ncbi:hypothetical protein FHW19_004183 [Ochrobactrum anthropi]|nr:hypothetical protein [Brucella anthropi]
MTKLIGSAVNTVSGMSGQLNDALRSHGRRVSMNMIAFATREDVIKKK